MFDLLLRRARLVDDTLTDIAIQDGKIAALGEISAPSRKTIELNGKVYVSAGWIDSHVHCYPNSPIYHDEPDSVGIATGVTTVIDAGSTGATSRISPPPTVSLRPLSRSTNRSPGRSGNATGRWRRTKPAWPGWIDDGPRMRSFTTCSPIRSARSTCRPAWDCT